MLPSSSSSSSSALSQRLEMAAAELTQNGGGRCPQEAHRSASHNDSAQSTTLMTASDQHLLPGPSLSSGCMLVRAGSPLCCTHSIGDPGTAAPTTSQPQIVILLVPLLPAAFCSQLWLQGGPGPCAIHAVYLEFTTAARMVCSVETHHGTFCFGRLHFASFSQEKTCHCQAAC